MSTSVKETKDLKNSLNLRITEISGQDVDSWFNDDFGAKKTIEFAPKFKSEKGHVKGKFVIDPSDKQNINISEEIEVQTKMHGNDTQFKLKGKEISGHFDMGFKSIGAHTLNPYLLVKLPRSASNISTSGSTTLGAVFHKEQTDCCALTIQEELSFSPADPAKDVKANIDLKLNSTLLYKKFIFGCYEHWNLTKPGIFQSVKLSAAHSHGPFNGFAQLALGAGLAPTNFTVGLRHRCDKWPVALHARLIKDLVDKEAKPDVSLGVAYKHEKGFDTKVAFNVQSKTIGSVLNFNINKFLTGTLLLDVRLV